jgi:Histidine kinase-like ATPase domain
MTGEQQPTVVRLEIPADPRIVRVARLAASALAAGAGFDVDEIDDVRIALDELCAVLFELGDGGPVSLEFTTEDASLQVVGRTPATTHDVTPAAFALSEQILGAACDWHTWSIEDGVASVHLDKRR